MSSFERFLSGYYDRGRKDQKKFHESEVEPQKSAKADELFDRLSELKLNPVDSSKLTKKELVAIKLSENIGAQKMKLLNSLKLYDSSIKLQDIEKIFLESKLPGELTDPSCVSGYILEYIKLKILERDFPKVISLCQRLGVLLAEEPNVFLSLYAFSVEMMSVDAYKIKAIALNFGILEENLAKVEASVNKARIGKAGVDFHVSDYASFVRGVRNNCSEETANEMVNFAKQYVPDFGENWAGTSERADSMKEITSIRKIVSESLRDLGSVKFTIDHYILISKKLDGIKLNLLGIIEKNHDDGPILHEARSLLFRIENAMAKALLGYVSTLRQPELSLDYGDIIARSRRLVEGGQPEEAVKLLNELVEMMKIKSAQKKSNSPKRTVFTPQEHGYRKIRPERPVEKNRADQFDRDEATRQKLKKLQEDFESALSKRDEVVARRILEALRSLMPLDKFTKLEARFFSMPVDRSRRATNPVWLNMGDREPINKLAYRVSDRHLKKEGDETDNN